MVFHVTVHCPAFKYIFLNYSGKRTFLYIHLDFFYSYVRHIGLFLKEQGRLTHYTVYVLTFEEKNFVSYGGDVVEFVTRMLFPSLMLTNILGVNFVTM